jgi:hypothetical protein
MPDEELGIGNLVQSRKVRNNFSPVRKHWVNDRLKMSSPFRDGTSCIAPEEAWETHSASVPQCSRTALELDPVIWPGRSWILQGPWRLDYGALDRELKGAAAANYPLISSLKS